MKKIISLIAFLLLCKTFLAQTGTDTVRAGIKSVFARKIIYGNSADTNGKKLFERSYDREGKITTEINYSFYNPKSADTAHFEYASTDDLKTVKVIIGSNGNNYCLKTMDKNGHLIRNQCEQDENYVYNSEGKLTTVYFKTPEGKKILDEKREYDKSGKLISIINYYQGTTVDSTVYSYSGKMKTEMRFNPARQCIEWRYFESHDSLVREIHFQPAEKEFGQNGYYSTREGYVNDSLVFTRDSSGNILSSFEKIRHYTTFKDYVDYFTYGTYDHNLLMKNFELTHNDTSQTEQWTYNENRKVIDYKKSVRGKMSRNTDSEIIFIYNSQGDLAERKQFSRGELTGKFIYEYEYY